jgi:hypothetical protein
MHRPEGRRAGCVDSLAGPGPSSATSEDVFGNTSLAGCGGPSHPCAPRAWPAGACAPRAWPAGACALRAWPAGVRQPTIGARHAPRSGAARPFLKRALDTAPGAPTSPPEWGCWGRPGSRTACWGPWGRAAGDTTGARRHRSGSRSRAGVLGEEPLETRGGAPVGRCRPCSSPAAAAVVRRRGQGGNSTGGAPRRMRRGGSPVVGRPAKMATRRPALLLLGAWSLIQVLCAAHLAPGITGGRCNQVTASSLATRNSNVNPKVMGEAGLSLCASAPRQMGTLAPV